MKDQVRGRLLLSALVLSVLSSCAPALHTAYHQGDASIEARDCTRLTELDCERPRHECKRPYDLAYLEFDDQGEPWDDKQLDRAITMIDRVNGSKGDERGDPDGAIFVTFVHGWRNNAAPDNHNLADLQYILCSLVRDEERAARNAGRPPRPVAGIYVAWRGDALHTSPKTPWLRWLDVFTFWNRNSTAVRIASRPPATQHLLIILKEIQGNRFARSIVVGHSMGALILERAMSQALVGVINEAKYRPPCPQCPREFQPGLFKPPADLIVLVNSAAPALQARHLVDVLKDEAIGEVTNRGEAPLLLSVTAVNDRATKRLFPIAMAIESRRQSFRNSAIRGQVVHTAGHTSGLHSHKPLDYVKNGSCTEPGDPFPLGIVRCRREEKDGSLAFTIDVENDGSGVTRRKFTIQRAEKRAGKDSDNSPYWIFQVPDTLIDGHSKFFTRDFVDFLRGVVTVTGASNPERGRLYSAETDTPEMKP